MKYFCKDCSYQGTTAGKEGECPGCGSYNLIRAGSGEQSAPPARWRLVLLIALWIWLGAMITWKLVNWD